MDENSTTATDNSEQIDATASGATDTESQATETTQTADNSDNLDSSKSTESSADGDKSTEGEEGANDSTTTSDKQFDSDLDEWAEKTGRPKPESDRERELYQEIRDGQREFSREKAAKAATKDVNDAIDSNKPESNKEEEDESDDPLEKRQNEIESQLQEERNLRLRSEFMHDKSVTGEEAKVMGDILKEKVEKGGKAAFDYWTNPDNLQDWLDLAKAKIGANADNSELEAEVTRRERERIAREQQATSPGRGAKQTTSADNTPEGKRLETFSNWD